MTARTLGRLTLALAAGALLPACAPAPRPLPAPEPVPAPDPSSVERVIFILGDAGEARMETSPVLDRLRQDVEWWAERLGADSAVTVLFLGDNVYPIGMHAPGTPEFPGDSAIVRSQVDVLAGAAAAAREAQGYFLAGNHDWGLEEEWDGYVRLRTLDAFLERAGAATGANVRLAPEAGTGGPYVLDLGRHLRLLLLDTAWWLLNRGAAQEAQRQEVLDGIGEAMRAAEGRHVLIVAHHPFRSAGPHGGEFSFWKTLGVRYILARSGAILQDVTSIPYRELESGLRAIFARHGPPPLFIGGHEHSLQILAAIEPTDPAYSIVSGSGSKLSGVGSAQGLLFGRSEPGYMRLLVARDGSMSIFVEATPGRFQSCPAQDPERAGCMAAGVAAFETVHSQHIADAPAQ